MTQAGYFIAAAVLAALIVVIANHGQPRPLEQKRKYVVVSFVIDGDTIILKAVQPHIRLWGVDAPEKGRDRYRRIVARVWLPDGQEVNRLMIEQGGASEYCRFSKGFYGQCYY